MGRDNVTEEQVRDRIANQWSEEQKVALADYIIANNGEAALIPQVLNIHNQLLQTAKVEG